MGLLAELDGADKKGLFRTNDNYVMYSTGILPLDYANGFWQEIITVDGEKKLIPAVGVMGGTFTGVIGATGGGKTTFADQMGFNMIKNFGDGILFHIDAEKTSNKQRILQITGASHNDIRIRLIKDHTTIDDVLEMVDDVCEAKESLGAACMYEAKTPGLDGKKFKVYPPTVFIIDSLPAFNGKDYNVKDLGSNADQLRAAKDVTRFYTNCLDRAWQYNLNFIIINHIRPKTDMNPYAQPPRGLMLLGPQEQLPRGQVAQYYSQTYFRINSKKSEAYNLEEHGFKGYRCTFQLAKSKTNMIGTSFPVAFNSATGFDQYYTLYEFAEMIGMIKGRNPYLYIENLEAYKFRRNEFRKKMMYEQEFANAVIEVLKPHLEALLSPPPTYETGEDGNMVGRYGDLMIDYDF